MMRALRLQGGGGHWPASSPFNAKRHRAMFDQAFWLVRVYYAAMLYIAYTDMSRLWNTALKGGSIDPIWPAFWATDVQTAGTSLLVALIASAVLAVAIPDRRWPRILVFVCFLMAAAFRTSFGLGSINHGNHYWLWLGFCFCFLPSGSREYLRTSLASRYRFLLTFWYTQALILLFYSMSGFWKVAAAIEALSLGEFSAFHPDALAQIVAWKMIEIGEVTVLGPLLAENPWVGWPAHLAVIYVELVAIMILFRPALHRLWGLMLIIFHIGTFFLLDISFPKHVLVLTLLFVWSPFIQQAVSVQTILRALPGLWWLAKFLPATERPIGGAETYGAGLRR